MKIKIDFRRPYFDEETIFKLSLNDLDDFYTDENDVNRLNLFFVLEATLHKFQGKNSVKAAARCAFLMAYYLFIPLTPPELTSWPHSILIKHWSSMKDQNIANGRKP